MTLFNDMFVNFHKQQFYDSNMLDCGYFNL